MKFKPASSIPHDLRLITRFEAAKLLRCTTQTITNWVNKGVIKGHWIDKYLFVDRQSIEELFDTASDVARMEDKLSELKSKISEELSELELSSRDSAIEAESSAASMLIADEASSAESSGILVVPLFPQALIIKAVLNASNSVFFLMIKLHFGL